MSVNIEPATSRLAALVEHVPDESLDRPTPCDISVGALLDHIGTLSRAFTAAATKDVHGPTGAPPPPSASHLDTTWRVSIPLALDELSDAWSKPEAWTGMTRIGGLDMPGEAAGVVAIDEVVVHGWDLARATGQPFDIEPAILDPLLEFVTHMADPGMTAARTGLFGPVVDVPVDAPALDRVIGLTGRDPNWSPV
jgi:uncharacterized protein (TIGR03086 family)